MCKCVFVCVRSCDVVSCKWVKGKQKMQSSVLSSVFSLCVCYFLTFKILLVFSSNCPVATSVLWTDLVLQLKFIVNTNIALMRDVVVFRKKNNNKIGYKLDGVGLGSTEQCVNLSFERRKNLLQIKLYLSMPFSTTTLNFCIHNIFLFKAPESRLRICGNN